MFDTSIMPYTNYTYDFKGMIDYIFYPKVILGVFFSGSGFRTST